MPHNISMPTYGPNTSPGKMALDKAARDKHKAEEDLEAGDFSGAFPMMYAMDQGANPLNMHTDKAKGEELLTKVKGLISSDRVALVGNRLWEKSEQGAWSPFGPSNLGSKNAGAIKALESSGVSKYGAESELPGYGAQEYGAPSITKEAFFNADGSKKTPQKVAQTLKDAGAEGTYEELLQQVIDFMPKLEEAPEEEKGFLAKEREFEEREAKMGREKDLYGLQKEASKVGAVMRAGMGGMGGGMRGAMAGGAQMGKEFGEAQDVYGLAREKAEFAEEKGIYGLEKGMYQDFESEVSATFFRKGGRVPQRGETFLDMLTQLPDAGGS